MLTDMATGKMTALPDMSTHVVDVRDCAAMHTAVMNEAVTDGHRHRPFSLVGKMTDITDIVRQNSSSVRPALCISHDADVIARGPDVSSHPDLANRTYFF